jgi:hypothetical protein
MAEIIRRLLEESARVAADSQTDPFLSLGRPGTAMGIANGARRHDEHVYGRRR